MNEVRTTPGAKEHRPKPIRTPLRIKLLKLAAATGGISGAFLSKSEEKAAFAMTQMAAPLLVATYWGPFDYAITEAGRAIASAESSS